VLCYVKLGWWNNFWDVDVNIGQSDRIRVRVPEAEVEFIERGRHGYDPSRKFHKRGNTRRQRKILGFREIR